MGRRWMPSRTRAASADYKRELVRISLVRGAGPGLGRARGAARVVPIKELFAPLR